MTTPSYRTALMAVGLTAALAAPAMSQTTLIYGEPGPNRGARAEATQWFADQVAEQSGGDLMLGFLSAVAFATIPILREDGWSDDGMQSVVRVDQDQVKQWVEGLLNEQAEGNTEKVAYSPEKTTVDVVNDTDINGLAAAVSQVLSGGGFTAGNIGNHDGERVANSMVRAPSVDDLGAQAVSQKLGNLTVVEDPSLAPGTVQVVLSDDYSGPGSGLEGTGASADPAASDWYQGYQGDDLVSTSETAPPPPSPIITAGSDDPQCVN